MYYVNVRSLRNKNNVLIKAKASASQSVISHTIEKDSVVSIQKSVGVIYFRTSFVAILSPLKPIFRDLIVCSEIKQSGDRESLK